MTNVRNYLYKGGFSGIVEHCTCNLGCSVSVFSWMKPSETRQRRRRQCTFVYKLLNLTARLTTSSVLAYGACNSCSRAIRVSVFNLVCRVIWCAVDVGGGSLVCGHGVVDLHVHKLQKVLAPSVHTCRLTWKPNCLFTTKLNNRRNSFRSNGRLCRFTKFWQVK